MPASLQSLLDAERERQSIDSGRSQHIQHIDNCPLGFGFPRARYVEHHLVKQKRIQYVVQERD